MLTTVLNAALMILKAFQVKKAQPELLLPKARLGVQLASLNQWLKDEFKRCRMERSGLREALPRPLPSRLSNQHHVNGCDPAGVEVRAAG